MYFLLLDDMYDVNDFEYSDNEVDVVSVINDNFNYITTLREADDAIMIFNIRDTMLDNR